MALVISLDNPQGDRNICRYCPDALRQECSDISLHFERLTSLLVPLRSLQSIEMRAGGSLDETACVKEKKVLNQGISLLLSRSGKLVTALVFIAMDRYNRCYAVLSI